MAVTMMGACDGGSPGAPVPTVSDGVEADRPKDNASPPLGAPRAGSPAASSHGPEPLVGEEIARAQWSRSRDRRGCAPLALASDAGAQGVARAADFSGGWGVAFDLPALRSAYGFAGPGLLPQDEAPAAAQRARLATQWPHLRDIDGLPAPAFAGYGLSGAEPYPADNPEGRGLHSVAYLRVGGQVCTYNVWSRISRAHLEALLDNLRLLR